MISKDATVQEAIHTVIDGGLSGMMVVEDDEKSHQKRVLGLVTSRDLLRIMNAALRDGVSPDDLMNQLVSLNMTPTSQLIYGRPEETIGMCRALMAKLGIKCLPILSKEGRVEGLVTARDMSDFGLSAADKGGKKVYLNEISERVGLSSDTSMAEPPTYLHAHLAMEQKPLFINVAVGSLPHPFKTPDGVGANQRGNVGAYEWLTDRTAFVSFLTIPPFLIPQITGRENFLQIWTCRKMLFSLPPLSCLTKKMVH